MLIALLISIANAVNHTKYVSLRNQKMWDSTYSS